MDFHHIGVILLIGVASNLDNSGVGIAYGLRKIRIPWLSNFTIAIISVAATYVAGIAGTWTAFWIPPLLAQLIGTIVLTTIGVWLLIQPFFENQFPPEKRRTPHILSRIIRDPVAADMDHSKTIGFGESLLLGIALAINAFAGGFDAGVTGIDVLATSFSVGLFSYVLLQLSAYIGEKYASVKLGKRASMFSGILLILIGLHQLY